MRTVGYVKHFFVVIVLQFGLLNEVTINRLSIVNSPSKRSGLILTRAPKQMGRGCRPPV